MMRFPLATQLGLIVAMLAPLPALAVVLGGRANRRPLVGQVVRRCAAEALLAPRRRHAPPPPAFAGRGQRQLGDGDGLGVLVAAAGEDARRQTARSPRNGSAPRANLAGTTSA